MNIKIVPSLRVVQFDADCASSRHFCAAICCRLWDVFLTVEEHASGKFRDEPVCLYDGTHCSKNVSLCFQRRWRLKKNQDGACGYLRSDDTCAYYEERPAVCREFTCAGGWKLDGVLSPEGASPKQQSGSAAHAGSPIDCSQNRLVVNQSMMLKTLFLDVGEKNAVLIIKPLSKCQPISLTMQNIPGGMDEASLMRLYEAFREPKTIAECAASAGVPVNDAETVVRQFFRCQLVVPVV